MSLVNSYASELFCRDVVGVIDEYHIANEYLLSEQYLLVTELNEVNKVHSNCKMLAHELILKYKTCNCTSFTDLRALVSSLLKLILPMLNNAVNYNYKFELAIRVRRKINPLSLNSALWINEVNTALFRSQIDDMYVFSIKISGDHHQYLRSIKQLLQSIFHRHNSQHFCGIQTDLTYDAKSYWPTNILTNIPYNAANDHSTVTFSFQHGLVDCSTMINYSY